MTTITKDLAAKIIAAGGIYDTRRYRYVAINDPQGFKRLKLDCLDTTAAYTDWEPVASPSYDWERVGSWILNTGEIEQ